MFNRFIHTPWAPLSPLDACRTATAQVIAGWSTAVKRSYFVERGIMTSQVNAAVFVNGRLYEVICWPSWCEVHTWSFENKFIITYV